MDLQHQAHMGVNMPPQVRALMLLRPLVHIRHIRLKVSIWVPLEPILSPPLHHTRSRPLRLTLLRTHLRMLYLIPLVGTHSIRTPISFGNWRLSDKCISKLGPRLEKTRKWTTLLGPTLILLCRKQP
jgi:hypothetical protein